MNADQIEDRLLYIAVQALKDLDEAVSQYTNDTTPELHMALAAYHRLEGATAIIKMPDNGLGPEMRKQLQEVRRQGEDLYYKLCLTFPADSLEAPERGL